MNTIKFAIKTITHHKSCIVSEIIIMHQIVINEVVILKCIVLKLRQKFNFFHYKNMLQYCHYTKNDVL